MKRYALAMITACTTVFLSQTGMAQKAQWVKTHSWSGHGTKQTEMFPVNGQKWRIRYYPEGEGLFQIAVYNEQNELLDMAANQDRAFPLKGFASLKGGGHRYLGITGLNTTWTVVVEQYLTAIEEWKLRQTMKQPGPELAKVGTWTGESGEAQYAFRIPAGSWQILCTQEGRGLLQVEVVDEEGFVALAANSDRPGQSVSWVHKTGTFSIKVKSDGPSWKIDVLAEP